MSKEMIKLNDISVKYGYIEALRDLNLTINEGEYVGIIGPNGGGKSTLLKVILNLEKPYKGTIKYNDTTMKKANIKMGYVPQITELNRMFPITVKEVILTAKLPMTKNAFHRFKKNDYLEVDEIIRKVGIRNIAERQISDLSGGEFQKMLLARALALNPDILFLDEPTAMIDAKSQKQIYNTLKKLSKEITIVIVSHDVKDITEQVDKLIFLDKNILAEGNPEEVYKYAFLKPTVYLRTSRVRKETSNL
jgi:zinc transport system ATP-binding protein